MVVASMPNYTHAPPPENPRKRKTTSHDIATWQRRRVPEVCSELEILAGFAPDWWKKADGMSWQCVFPYFTQDCSGKWTISG